jgi:hypothetical protein
VKKDYNGPSHKLQRPNHACKLSLQRALKMDKYHVEKKKYYPMERKVVVFHKSVQYHFRMNSAFTGIAEARI